MPLIHVLPKEIADLIAAGEVVERPASVMKEFLENSIDAGASVITAEIAVGGKTYLRVTDNGSGIRADDVRNAFVSHATSKLRAAEDLDAIGTLGFRGEALASVAAVSKVDLITRTAEENFGTHYVVEGGKEILLDEAGCPVGTTLVVRDLFFNIPARLKFLKKDVQEGNAVASVLQKLSLSHPEISFRLIRDGKTVLSTPGDGKLLSAIYAVFGKDFADSLIEVSAQKGGIGVSGFIGKPSAGKSSRSLQLFYINSRTVKSIVFMTALEAAYKNAMLVGKYPVCVLFVDAPLSSVDVNVHPAKTEVRFFEEKRLFDAVYMAALSALEGDTSRPQGSFRTADAFRAPTVQGEQLRFRDEHPAVPKEMPVFAQGRALGVTVHEYGAPRSGTETVLHSPDAPPEPPVLDFLSPDAPSEAKELRIHFGTEEEGKGIGTPNPSPALPEDTPVLPTEPTDAGAPAVLYLGEAFHTYLMAECGDKLLLIDKHAAHERILFDELKARSKNPAVQLLLTPTVVTLSTEEYQALLDNTQLLADAGYEISDFGERTVKLESCPAMLAGENTEALITEIATYLSRNDRSLMPEKLDWILHSTACRAAIKAGDFTSRFEAEHFVKELLSRPEIRTCPHGRPVLVEVPRRELEKQFKRIV